MKRLHRFSRKLRREGEQLNRRSYRNLFTSQLTEYLPWLIKLFAYLKYSYKFAQIFVKVINTHKHIYLMRKTFTVFAIVTVMSLLLPGCATIFTRTVYPVSVNCNPTVAQLEVLDKRGVPVFKGTTPVMLQLKSSAGFFSPAQYTLRFSAEGYSETIVNIQARLDGWYFGNIFIGGLLGMLIIDPATGAMWKIDEMFINASLSPNTQQALNLLDIKDLPEEYRDHLVQLK